MSLLVKMAWRNVWRNPRRSILTLCAIAFATSVLIFTLSWQFGNYAVMINTMVKLRGGHLHVQANGYKDGGELQLVVHDPEDVAHIVARTSGVKAYSFRANAFSLVSAGARSSGALIIGVDAKETVVSDFAKMIRHGEYISPGDRDQALVGSALANFLKVDLGDEVILLGQGYDGSVAASSLRVKGIVSSGQDEFDRSSVLISLPYFQDLYSMNNTVHEVIVICHDLSYISQVKQSLATGLKVQSPNSDLVVLDWAELLPGLNQVIKMDFALGFIFYIILIVIVAFSILNTFLMTIFERTREFGLMIAVGCTPDRLTKLLLLESGIMILMGTIIGSLGGCLITWYFQVHGILIPGALELAHKYGFPERMIPRLSLLSVAIGAGIVLVISLLTAIYPTLRMRRYRPVKAMKAV